MRVVFFSLVLVLAGMVLTASAAEPVIGTPVQPAGFRHAGIIDAWTRYADVLSFGKGQTLALVDDGCKLSMPEWLAKVDGIPKHLRKSQVYPPEYGREGARLYKRWNTYHRNQVEPEVSSPFSMSRQSVQPSSAKW